MIIGCNPSMTDFITLTSHCVVGVGKESSVMGAGKDSDMVHE